MKKLIAAALAALLASPSLAQQGPTGQPSLPTFGSSGVTVGTFSAATCSNGTYILSGLPTAAHGYSCHAYDQTTTADTLVQTASSATSATFKSTTASSDVINVGCLGF